MFASGIPVDELGSVRKALSVIRTFGRSVSSNDSEPGSCSLLDAEPRPAYVNPPNVCDEVSWGDGFCLDTVDVD